MKRALVLLRKLAFLEAVLPYRVVLPLRLYLQKRLGMIEPETRVLKYILKRGDHVVDVGMNAGIYSYLLSRMGCRVEAFEPLEYYSKRLRRAGLKNLRLHDVALSDVRGAADIHIPIIDGQLRRTRASIEFEAGNEQVQRIELVPLDDYNFTDLRFIKIDVEGHEFAVLRGGVKTISRSMPVVLVEIEEHRLIGATILDVFNWFSALGYEGYFYRNGELNNIGTFDSQRDQAKVDSTYKDPDFIDNFLFVPRGSDIELPVNIGTDRTR